MSYMLLSCDKLIAVQRRDITAMLVNVNITKHTVLVF
jgi:hypothetical protein